MGRDLIQMCSYMAASALVLAAVIYVACGLRGGRAPAPGSALLVASVISVVGILFGKYGQNFGLPWQVYYSVPMLSTVFGPVLIFRMSPLRAIVYVLLAFATAPLIHAAFFYALGWNTYMPFLHLPR